MLAKFFGVGHIIQNKRKMPLGNLTLSSRRNITPIASTEDKDTDEKIKIHQKLEELLIAKSLY